MSLHINGLGTDHSIRPYGYTITVFLIKTRNRWKRRVIPSKQPCSSLENKAGRSKRLGI